MSAYARKQSAKRWLDCALVNHAPRSRYRMYYWNLVNDIRSKSSLLAIPSGASPTDFTQFRTVICAIAKLTQHRKHWTNMPEFWTPQDLGYRRQFRSLLRHLFERYPVPDFLANDWLEPCQSDWSRQLYLHMAQGFSIRQFSPRSAIPISPQTARWIMQVPPHLEPYPGIRWAQICGLGGTRELANCLAKNSILDYETSDEPFWESVLRFLIRNMPLCLDEAQEIVNFANEQKFEAGEYAWGHGGGTSPLQPEFTLKGRTLRSLRRHMANWRQDILKKRPELAKKTFDWPRSEFAPLVHHDGDAKWLIFELLSDRALKLEGNAMNHCVYDYVGECLERTSSIWSVRIQRSGTPKRMVTIEVDPKTRKIVQARGKCNSTPTLESKQVLRFWAEREGLTLTSV